MTIGIVGLGSMGKRRIRLLQKIDAGFSLVGIDAREDRREEAQKLYGITVSEDLEKAIEEHGIQAVVVSTSPLSHGGIIKTALQKNCHVFTELNLVEDLYEENMRLAEQNGRVLFLSSTMMFREEIGFISREVGKSSLPVNYSYHVGQFLPTWHSWESYKDFFVANKRTNGCREVFAIELPWLIKAFGKIESCQVLKGRMTDLDLDYPDNFEVLVSHENGNRGTLNINVASQFAVRNLEVYGQQCYMRWGGTPDSLLQYEQESGGLKKIALYDETEQINSQNRSIIEDAYEMELREFIGAIQDGLRPRYSFEEDREVLHLIDHIEGAGNDD